MSNNQICAERLYLTSDRDALVPEGDGAAAFLYAAPGDEIPASAAEKFGLKDGRLKAAMPADSGTKEQAPPPNKEKAAEPAPPAPPVKEG